MLLFMKRLITFILLISFVCPVAWSQSDTLTSQQIKEILRDNPALAGGNHYVPAFQPYSVAPAPKGYKPVYISHYGRHGARYSTSSKKYDTVWNLLPTKGTTLCLSTEFL